MLNICLCQFPILAQFNELRTGERIWIEKREKREIRTAYGDQICKSIHKTYGNPTELLSE